MTGLVYSCELAVQRFGWSLILGGLLPPPSSVFTAVNCQSEKEGEGGDVAADYWIDSSSQL
jgi:hypothetical protein